jgi:predicted dienelactone hydrolase
LLGGLTRVIRTLAACAAAAIVGLGALLGALWLEHRAATALPTPTGAYPVGRAILDWKDEHAVDPMAPVAGMSRELLAWIWYPAAAQPEPVIGDYLPAASAAAAERLRSHALPVLLIDRVLTRDLSKVRAHSAGNAAVASRERAYPVLILRGGASAPVATYTTLAEDLASHGYIVVGIDAPFRTTVVAFPDGRAVARTPHNNPELCEGKAAGCIDRLLAAWVGDIGFAIDRLQQLNGSDPSGRFTGRLDLSRVGVFGHSFGGAQAAQFCHDDARCKAGVDIDGMPFGSVIRDGLQQPFMFLLSAQIHGSDREARQVGADIQSIYDHQPAAHRLRIAIRGANHFLFSDDGALLKSHLVMRLLRGIGVVGIEGRRQLAVTAYCVRSFFDAQLKVPGRAPIDFRSPDYPEIEVLE